MSDLRITSATSAPAALRPFRLPEFEPKPATGFGETLGAALGTVNRLQQEAGSVATRLAAGETTDLAQAVVGIEKANVSFQFALQIRNKLLEAYQEIMRMQV